MDQDLINLIKVVIVVGSVKNRNYEGNAAIRNIPNEDLIQGDYKIISGFIGGIIGAYIGYLLSPVSIYNSNFGMDKLIGPIIWRISWNYIIVGGILGAFIGFVTYHLTVKK